MAYSLLSYDLYTLPFIFRADHHTPSALSNGNCPAVVTVIDIIVMYVSDLNSMSTWSNNSVKVFTSYLKIMLVLRINIGN